ncbi:MAG: glycosyltransferase [bacterium]|nr:glycosyltransferase [bacterium]
MRCILTPVGSAGDVFPLIGLGKGLVERGYEAVITAPEPFRQASLDAGLQFEPTWQAEQYQDTINDPNLWHPRRGLRLVLKAISDSLHEAYEQLERLYVPGETILISHTLAFATRVFEEKTGAPAATVHLAPSVFRSDFRQPVMPNQTDLSGWPIWLKRMLWGAVDRWAIDPYVLPALNTFRERLGLQPVYRVFKHWLHSPRQIIGFFPDWFGEPQSDWPRQLTLTGFPLYDHGTSESLNDELEAYLEAGEPPIVFTPGSANLHAARFFHAAAESAEMLKRRALFVTMFQEQLTDTANEYVHSVKYAPFSKLFSRCAAVVHHGGIGTCAKSFAAGVPQLITPMGFDQPDNAARVARLGTGALLEPRRVTGRHFARELERLLSSDAVADSCMFYQNAVNANNAIERACAVIERLGNN